MSHFPRSVVSTVDPRKLSIESIEIPNARASGILTRRGQAQTPQCAPQPDDESCNRDLVWRDSRFARERDYRGFDWRVDVSGKIQLPFWRRIQNNAFRDDDVPVPGTGKQSGRTCGAYLDDVIVTFAGIHGSISRASIFCLRSSKAAPVRARQKEARVTKSRPLGFGSGVDDCGGLESQGRSRVPGRQGGKQTPIAIDVCRDN